MKRFLPSIVLSCFIFVLLISPFAFAETKTFLRDYTYQAGEADSKVTSRTVAMEQVKRLLLEEIGTYLESSTEVKNFELTKDQITALTAGIVKLKIMAEQWNGEKYWLKAEMVVDADDVTKKIDVFRQDRVKIQELENAKKRVEELLRENESLRKSASKTDQTSVKRYEENVKSIETEEIVREVNILDEEVKSAWAQVENLLQRRCDLIPNLVSIIKGYAGQEDVLVEVTNARDKVKSAASIPDKINANNQLTLVLSRLMVVVEKYPDVKSNQGFLRLQKELAKIENRISLERIKYNEAIQVYNKSIKSFPANYRRLQHNW